MIPNSKAAIFQNPSKYEKSTEEIPLDEGNKLRETLKGKRVLEDNRSFRPMDEWELRNSFRL